MQWPWRRASCASRKRRAGELRPHSRLLDLAALARYPQEYAAAQRSWAVANRRIDGVRGGAGVVAGGLECPTILASGGVTSGLE